MTQIFVQGGGWAQNSGKPSFNACLDGLRIESCSANARERLRFMQGYLVIFTMAISPYLLSYLSYPDLQAFRFNPTKLVALELLASVPVTAHSQFWWRQSRR